ncbi:hypothetical protein JW979_00075, partial [bacterium]|nr:hypothetical protein [candidate division CSSED10-310 bacterium]
DKTLNMNMASTDMNMDHYNACGRFYGQNPRWNSPPHTVYIIQNVLDQQGQPTGREINDEEKNTIIDVVKNRLPKLTDGFFPRNINIEIGNDPPNWGTAGYIIVAMDGYLPFQGANASWGAPDIYSAMTRLKPGTIHYPTYLQELSQNMGFLSDSDLIQPSVFNNGSPDNYTQHDLLMGKFKYNRPSSNRSPDKN